MGLLWMSCRWRRGYLPGAEHLYWVVQPFLGFHETIAALLKERRRPSSGLGATENLIRREASTFGARPEAGGTAVAWSASWRKRSLTSARSRSRRSHENSNPSSAVRANPTFAWSYFRMELLRVACMPINLYPTAQYVDVSNFAGDQRKLGTFRLAWTLSSSTCVVSKADDPNQTRRTTPRISLRSTIHAWRISIWDTWMF